MKVAVSGASGFVGRYVVEALSARGDEVVALGRDEASLEHLEGPRVLTHATDYAQPGLEPALAGVDAVVHLAGRRTLREDEPLRFWPFAEANLRTLENLLFAARQGGATRFVLISSTAVYSAGNATPWRESDPALPLNPYGLSKLFSEQMVAYWGRNSPLAATSLRVAACYGFGERISAVLMRFVDEAMNRRPLTIRGNGQISVEQIYVRDVAAAVLAALDEGNPGGVFNIGAGRTFTLVEMAEAVNEAFGNSGNLVFEDQKSGEVKRTFMDIGHAAATLGWRPQFDLSAGLRDFYETWRKSAA